MNKKTVIYIEIVIAVLLIAGIVAAMIAGASNRRKEKKHENAAGTQVTESVSEEESQETGNAPSEEPVPEHKVIYLTFDDGPDGHTPQLLDLLDKYQAKVTFFVTAQAPDYLYLIAEEAKRGHTVAVHSYSHRYEQVYSSPEAYVEDFQKMNEVIRTQTGKEAKLFRFPGGASNGTSKKYCVGIMTDLTQRMTDLGYTYVDWNVESRDAGQAKSAEEIYDAVINGALNHDASVVLMHDIHQMTIDAVESILVWGKNNGYVFLPLTEKSPECKHNVTN